MALKLGELVAYLKADDTHLARGIKAAQDKMRQAGQKAKEYAPVMGAAMAAGIGAGLLQGMDLEAARAKLSAQVGDPALADRLGKAAGAVYGRGFGESATDAMLAARSVMQAGLLPKNADAAIIEDLTVKAQTLAQVFGLDVTQAARAAGQMVRTGLAKNASEAFDIITKTMQVTGDQADDLLDTITEYSTQFREVGISGPKAMGMLAQASRAGARDLDTVADAIKEFAIRSQDGSATSAAAFKSIGLNAKEMTATFAKGGPEADKAMSLVLSRLKEMKDPVEQRAAAVALFGAKAEDLGDALYAIDPTTAVAGLGDLKDATKKAGDALENSGAQKLEAFKRKAQQALVEKLSEALPTLEKVGGWLDKHKSIVGPLATGLGVLAVVIGVVLGVYKVWIALQTALNIVMMLNPIGLIVLAVIGLILIIVGLWLKFEGFRNFWKKTWEVIKESALAVWDFIVAAAKLWWKTFSGFWTGVGRFFVKLWGGIVDGVKSAWGWITDKFDAVVKFVSGLPKRIGKAASGMWDGIKNAFKSAVNWIIRKWNDLSFRIPGISVPGLGQVWGGATLSTPNLPMLAKGGNILNSGMAIVGEAGPELVHLGRGATVQPLPAGGGGHAEMRLTGEFRVRGGDLVLVLRDQVAGRGGNVQQVIGSNY
ncbi:phage tail tape measure protein [Micromonospora sp. NPDC048930]|uniref:phage tail tape measure protein n=1 Tax=Micromonospora sp. NPDC048930 TaxID=3364261 RepID=UPI00371FC8E8